MRIQIDIPDELYELYGTQAKTTAKAEIEHRLARFKDIAQSERCLIIHGAERLKLEAVFQTTVETFERLYNQIKNMGSVKIGPVERVFTPDEIIRLRDQARFHGWSDEDFIKLTVDEALNYVFDRI